MRVATFNTTNINVVNKTSTGGTLSGNEVSTVLTVPAAFIPSINATYIISLQAQVPDETDGTILAVSNGTTTWQIRNVTGSYIRCRNLGTIRRIILKYNEDPARLTLVSLSR